MAHPPCVTFNVYISRVLPSSVELLCTQRGQQEQDLAGCLQMKNKLTDEAQQLAEKYQEAADKRSVLVYRWVGGIDIWH